MRPATILTKRATTEKISRKQKWEEKQLDGHYKRQTVKILTRKLGLHNKR